MRWPPMSASPLAVRAPRWAYGLPCPLKPRPGATHSRPEVRTARAPATRTNRDPASFVSLRSVCVMKDASDSQPQEQLYVAAQRPHRRPPTQDPRCWRPLNITALVAGPSGPPVTLTACGPAAQTLAPRRTRSARTRRALHPSRHTLTPLLCSDCRGRSPPTPHARPLHPRGLRQPPQHPPNSVVTLPFRAYCPSCTNSLCPNTTVTPPRTSIHED